MRYGRLAALLAVLLPFAGIGVAAETHFGALTFTRHAEVKGLYDSNIFLQPGVLDSGTPTGSAILSLAHDLGFAFDLKRTQLFLGYQIQLLQYDQHPSVNNAVEQSATAWWTYGAGEASSLGLDDQFVSTTDPASSELVERARRNQNNVIARAETGVGRRFFLGLDGGHEVHDYLGAALGPLLNRSAFLFNPILGWKVTEKARLFADFPHAITTYDDAVSRERDNTTGGAELAASGEFTPRLHGRVGAGFELRTFSHTETGLAKSRSLPAWNAGLTWNAPGAVFVSLATSQATQESLFNRYDVSTLAMVSVGRPFGKTVKVSAYVLTILDAYPDAVPTLAAAKRKDSTFQTGASAAWSAKSWLTVSAEVLNRSRDSNLDVFDYAERVVSAGVAATY